MPKSPKRTFTLRDFGVGIDLRQGSYSASQNRFRDLVNCVVDKGRHLRRRFPKLRVNGTYDDTRAQGLFEVEGRLTTIGSLLDPPVHTGDVATDVDTLLFDPPSNAGLATTGNWELIQALTVDGIPAAIIRHQTSDPLFSYIDVLHVWDDAPNQPTFVFDPAVPVNAVRSRPLHVYRDDPTRPEYPVFEDYTPFMVSAQGKLWISTPEGDFKSCATRGAGREYNLRVWNEFSQEELLEFGEWFYGLHIWANGATGTNLNSLEIPIAWEDLYEDRKYSCWICEYLDETGTWVKMIEDRLTGFAGPGPFDTNKMIFNPIPATWADRDVTRLTWAIPIEAVDRIRAIGAVPWVRCRVIAGDPPLKILDGVEPITAGATAPQNINTVGPTGPTVPQSYDTGTTAPDFDGTLTLDGKVLSWARRGTAQESTAEAKVGTWIFGGGNDYVTFGAWEGNGIVVNGLMYIPSLSPGTISNHLTHLKIYTGPDFDNLSLNVSATFKVSGNAVYVDDPGADPAVRVMLDPGNNVTLAIAQKNVQSSVGHYSFEGQNFNAPVVNIADELGVDERWLFGLSHDTGIVDHMNQADEDGNSQTNQLTGFQRYHLRILRVLNTDAGGAIANGPIVSGIKQGEKWFYAHEVDTSGDPTENEYQSPFYIQKELDLGLAAGALDAVQLNTSREDNTGGKVLGAAAIKNRLAVFYSRTTQVWQIDVDPSNNAFLDSFPFGVLAEDGQAVITQFFNQLIVPTPFGWRSLALTGLNSDSLRDIGIGEPISELFPVTPQAGIFWPYTGQFIAALDDGQYHVFDFSTTSRLQAWGRWTVNTNPVVDKFALVPILDRLYALSGSDLFYFDATATTYRDFLDPAAPENAYESLAAFHLNDFGRAGDSKRFLFLDASMVGSAQVGLSFVPEDLSQEWRDVWLDGITYGNARIPILGMTAPAIAPTLRSYDENGWRLEQLSIDFMYLRR